MITVLMFSLDRGLLKPGLSDTENRLRDYSAQLGQVYVLIPSAQACRRRAGEKITILGISGIMPVKAVRLILQGIRITRESNVDLIVTNDVLTGLVGWIVKKFSYHSKLNVNVLGLEIADRHWLAKNPFRHRIFRWVETFVLRQADSIRSDSRRAISQLQDLGISPQKMFYVPVIPSPAAQKIFNRLGRKKEKSNRSFEVLSVGSLIPQKGFDILFWALVSVFAAVPQARLTLVGSGAQESSLRQLARRLRIADKINFIGPVNYVDLPKFYRQADLLVVSSWYEGGPRVVMETALAGLPAVSTRVGSVEDMLTSGKSIIIVDPGDSAALSLEIINLIKNRTRLRKVGNSARREIQSYCNYPNNTARLMSLWRKTAAL